MTSLIRVFDADTIFTLPFMHFLTRDSFANFARKHYATCSNQFSDNQDVSRRLAPPFACHIISVMIQNENDKHMSELTLRRQFIYPLIEMLHDTSMQSFQR